MNKPYLKFFILFAFCGVALSQIDTYANVASRVFFQVHPKNAQPFNLTTNMAYFRQFCPANVQISWIVHGWLEGFYRTEWVPLVLNSTLQAAGGCVIFMDYSYFSVQGYDVIVYRYALLRDVLADAVKRIGNYNMTHFFGFSFGARLAIGVGNNLTALNNGTTVLPRMDLCDPAGPSFELTSTIYIPPQKAAKNVACIDTSDGYGTNVYNCHQNFKMGHCGRWQDAQGPYPKGSHGLCPYMYYHAFKNDFKYNPVFQGDCYYPYTPNRPINATCQQNMTMGYKNTMYCIGDVLVPTAICPPYVYNGTIYNYPKGKGSC